MDEFTRQRQNRVRAVARSRLLVLGIASSSEGQLGSLRRACALVECHTAHRIELVIAEGPIDRYRDIDGLILFDAAVHPKTRFPRLEAISPTEEDLIAALTDFIPPLSAVRERREAGRIASRIRVAIAELGASELRAFHQARETWDWNREEAVAVLLRGAARARERRRLLAAGQSCRTSLTSRFRWRELHEELCDELAA